MDKYYIVAKIHPKAGMEDQLQTRIQANIPLVRQESGCLRYDLHKSRSDNTFTFYEIWADKASFEAHVNTAPHMKQYRADTKDMVEKPSDITILSAVDLLD